MDGRGLLVPPVLEEMAVPMAVMVLMVKMEPRELQVS
jgi:hypothetical protein